MPEYNVQDLKDNLDYLTETKNKIKKAIQDKNVEVADTDTFRSYADKIATIEPGINTDDATATTSQILNGYTAYVKGNKITGTMKNLGYVVFTPKSVQQTLSDGYVTGVVVNAASITNTTDYQTLLDKANMIYYGNTKTPFIETAKLYYKGNTLENQSLIETGLSGTLFGDYVEHDDCIEFTGGYANSGYIYHSYGSFEMCVKIPTTFTPIYNTNWFYCSALMGCEMSGAQRDWGVILNASGYIGIGYSWGSTSFSSKKINDGNLHHIVINVNSSSLKLYVDGTLIRSVSHSFPSNAGFPDKIGIFYNGANMDATEVKGSLYMFRYYPLNDMLTEDQITRNSTSSLAGVY